jgi:EAL and modified HD-GYP domain-containing signal transduction protein
MRHLLTDLPLTPEILDALLKREGVLGAILEGILAYERGEWNQQASRVVELHILNSVYWQSIEWANGIMETVIRKKEQS